MKVKKTGLGATGENISIKPTMGVIIIDGNREELKQFVNFLGECMKEGKLAVLNDSCKLFNFENGKWVRV